MNELVLSIKQKYFDQIKSGEKKIETREIRPQNVTKYCEFADEEHRDLIGPRHYDQIRFLTGPYKDKRQSMTVQVLDATIIFYVDEETGEELWYEENGEEYSECDIEYQLGDILSCDC